MVSMSYPRLHVNVIVLSCQHYRKSLRQKYVDHYSFGTCGGIRRYAAVHKIEQQQSTNILMSAKEYR